MKAPFVYFGGKTILAPVVWERFGNTPNYVEPFCGSAAVMLNRPANHEKENGWSTETINDLNGYLTNVWRALKYNPDDTAWFADFPVSEIDLHARGDEIFYGRPGNRKIRLADKSEVTPAEFVERLRGDAEWYDQKVAGWWVWGNCSWIGDNWSAKKESEVVRSLPHLGGAGRGVNRKLPHLGNAGRGDTVWPDNVPLRDFFRQLAARLRRVRICCGDWTRVISPAVTWKAHGLTGIFLDPPYACEGRDAVYGEEESFTVAHDVRKWAVENGDNPLLRICLCGYDEHDGAMPAGWERHEWIGPPGYGSQKKFGDNKNREREVAWFSPHCLKPAGLFVELHRAD